MTRSEPHNDDARPDGKGSPAALLRQHGLQAKKSWGQCFLHDPGVVRRIVEASGAGSGDTVVEIGAGLGVLTGALAAVAGRVVAVERDRDMCAILRERFGGEPGAPEVREANALTLDLSGLPGPLRVVGNLPYNISSPILFHLLAQRRHLVSATLMFQKELALRLVAAPGSRTYGSPSVICQRAARLQLCFLVPRGAFFPSPKVDSAVVHLDFTRAPGDQPGQGPEPGEDEHFSRVVRAAFARRRKTLRRALCPPFTPQQVSEALQAADIAGERRAETLGVEEFERLSGMLR